MNKLKNKNYNNVRILFLIGSYQIGGAELHLYKLIRELKNQIDFSIELILLSNEFGRYKELDIPIYKIRTGKHLISIKTFLSILNISRKFRGNVTIIHSFLNEANFIASVLKAVMPKTKLVISKRNQDNWTGIQKFYAWVSNNMAELITVNARSLIDWFHKEEKIPYCKIHYLPNAIEKDSIRNINKYSNNDKIVFINVASLTPKKAQKNLLEAFAITSKTYDNIELWLVGDGPLKQELEYLSSELKISKYVNWFGIRNDVKKLLSKSDVFILPSHKEGMSNALLEAASSGLFCIVNDTGSNKEIIKESQHGFVMENNNPDTIADDMQTTIKNKMYFRSEKAASRIKKTYSTANMFSMYIDLYNQLI
ncbi:MAG: glycosyltransferase [Candidatus Cloacimonetes bacterium]|nr:glycosyltransferase [Candidatus Cloacimonadota bacterium]